MPSHMGVQKFATVRNSQVEFVVHFLLEKLCARLSTVGNISEFEVTAQKKYSSEIASDIWDHFISATQTSSNRKLEVWCQTTCYKGNAKGRPEPNKTYEVRETLVEGISIRQRIDENPDTDIRTIHFTVGDKNYTYQWFLGMKSACYDKSVYVGQSGLDLFELIADAFKGLLTEEEKSEALEDAIKQKDTLGVHLSKSLQELECWWIEDGMPEASLARLQWQLVDSEKEQHAGHWPDLTKACGADIKGRTNALLFTEDAEESDPLIPRTAAKLLKKNPFLATAIEVVASWEPFCRRLKELKKVSANLDEYLFALWNINEPEQLLTRRILLRIHTDESIQYVQDLDVDGISEHNLYLGDHDSSAVRQVCEVIKNNLQQSGIDTQEALFKNIESKGKRIINQARWFESKNGTQLKPSFEYTCLNIQSAGFEVLTPKQAGIHALGYHAQIVSENVNPYTNLKVVRDKKQKNLCILKAKFLRVQEFPRRCKEEAFVGLSLKYSFQNTPLLGAPAFIPALDMPLIMFVDMSKDCVPPEYAVKRLISFGWDVIFSQDDLINRLQILSQES